MKINILFVLALFFLGATTTMAATEQQKNLAVSKGLQYLINTQQEDGSWHYMSYDAEASPYDPAVTGASLLAFLGLKYRWPNDDVLESLFYQTAVDKAVTYLLNIATTVTVSTRNDGLNICPGGTGECLGIYWGADSGEESYITGLVTPALMTYAQDRGSTVATTTGPLANLTWSQIAQGIVNTWSASQSTEQEGNMIGGWRYTLGMPNYDSDMSTTQWGIMSLIYAAQYLDSFVPEIVKTDLKKWLAFAQDPNSGGGCYQGPESSLCNHSDTGGLLLGLKFVGAQVTDATVQKALGYLNTHWPELAENAESDFYGNFGHPYAMWSLYKGLEVTLDGVNNTTVITNLLGSCGAPDNLPSHPCNWWEDYNDWLVNHQNVDGSWSGWSYWSDPLSTAFYISIIGPVYVPGMTLFVKVDGDGTVTSDPPGIDCGVDCTEMFLGATSMALTAHPGLNATFAGWSGACTGTAITCNITVDQARSVTASFVGHTHQPLNLSISGNGTVRSDPAGIDCGTDCTESYVNGTEVTLTATPDPGWQFTGWGGACTGTSDCTLSITGPTKVTANFTALTNRYRLDTPVNDSFESGIGVVHGWVCEANEIGLQVDDRAPFTAAYGAERPDSQDVCGDTFNGFAAAINWAEYGDGEHTLTLLADGQPLTEAHVTITTLGASFLTGLSATTTVKDFPAPGFGTRLLWSEPHQNFVVSTTSAPAGAANATSATSAGNWESPLAGGVESGQALIRGWVCTADTVSVELDGELLTLPYGSERDDTRTLCGDTDNGYALAINWNDYGDGPHQIRLLLNGAPIETRAFQVATPGGQGTVSGGVQRQHPVSDFPNLGDRLTLQWSEPNQNFRIIAYTAAVDPTPQSYYRKVNAYVYGTFGRSATFKELAEWGAVLRDNKGSVWKPKGAGLQPYLSDAMGWGTAPLDRETATSIVAEIFGNLFGSSNDLDPRLTSFYVDALVNGFIKPRGAVNAILNDLAIMPRVDGTYGQPNGWTGGPGKELLTSEQLARYRERVETWY